MDWDPCDPASSSDSVFEALPQEQGTQVSEPLSSEYVIKKFLEQKDVRKPSGAEELDQGLLIFLVQSLAPKIHRISNCPCFTLGILTAPNISNRGDGRTKDV